MLRKFWDDPKHPHAEGPLHDWYKVVRKAEWRHFADVKGCFNSCDRVGNKTVFDVGGNHYRVVTVIDYEAKIVYIRAVLDHKEYDKEKWKLDSFGNNWKPFKVMIQDRPNGRNS